MPRRIAVPPSLRRVASFQDGLVSTGQCLEHGMTYRQAATLVADGRWERVVRGVLDTGLPHRAALMYDAYDLARRRTALLGPLAYPGAVATGLSALVLQDVQGAPQHLVSDVGFPDGSPRARRGSVRVRREPLRRRVVVDGIACAPAELALAQAAPDLDRRHAVALMDSARQRRVLTEDGFRQARDLARGRRGAARVSGFWDESDPRAESPAESWGRVSAVDQGVPPDALQLVVQDSVGRFRARVDMAWHLTDGGVLLVEVDGRQAHSRLAALVDDRARQNRIASRRTTVLRFSGRSTALTACRRSAD